MDVWNKPCIVTMTLAMASGKLVPAARIVRPVMLSGMFKVSPGGKVKVIDSRPFPIKNPWIDYRTRGQNGYLIDLR